MERRLSIEVGYRFEYPVNTFVNDTIITINKRLDDLTETFGIYGWNR